MICTKKLSLKKIKILTLSALIFMSFGCNQLKKETTSDTPDVLAVIDGKVISAGDIKDEIVRRPERYSTQEQREALLEKKVNFEMLYAAAIREGYDQDPEIQDRVRRLIAGKFREDQLESKLTGLTVAEKEIEDFYANNKQEFISPGKVKAAVIKITKPANASKEKKTELFEKAKFAREESLNLPAETVSFGSVAVKYSDHQATRYRGGDVGWLHYGKGDSRWEKEVMDALFSLSKPGEISPIIEASKGYYIVKFIDGKEESVRPLSSVRDKIYYQILTRKKKEAQGEFYKGLKEKVEVKIFTDRLNNIKIPEAIMKEKDKKPPTMPGRR